MSDRDLDAEFARIVAGWDAEAPDPLPRLLREGETDTVRGDVGDVADVGHTNEAPDDSADEAPQGGTDPRPDAPDPGNTVPGATGGPGSSGAPAPAASSGLLELPIAPTTSHAWRGGTARDDADAFDDDEHFVPPSEIELPSAENDPMFWAIVGGLVGGPLLLLYLLFFDRDGSGWWIVTALAMIVVGFVLLVLRGGTERDPFDDGTRL